MNATIFHIQYAYASEKTVQSLLLAHPAVMLFWLTADQQWTKSDMSLHFALRESKFGHAFDGSAY